MKCNRCIMIFSNRSIYHYSVFICALIYFFVFPISAVSSKDIESQIFDPSCDISNSYLSQACADINNIHVRTPNSASKHVILSVMNDIYKTISARHKSVEDCLKSNFFYIMRHDKVRETYKIVNRELNSSEILINAYIDKLSYENMSNEDAITYFDELILNVKKYLQCE